MDINVKILNKIFPSFFMNRSGWVYSTNAKLDQYLKINQYNLLH